MSTSSLAGDTEQILAERRTAKMPLRQQEPLQDVGQKKTLHAAEPRSAAPTPAKSAQEDKAQLPDISISSDRVGSPSVIPHQLGQRPTLASARRLTIHDSSSTSRPSLLTKRLWFKSSSAVPTLSTLAATSTASSSRLSDIAKQARRASSGGFTPSSRGSMAARDISATDLLKQAISHRVADDEHDHIDSTSSTPPGAVTPQPDFTDKRLPGIVHSCFGQVGNFLRTFHSETHLTLTRNFSSETLLKQDHTRHKASSMSMPLTPPLTQESGNLVSPATNSTLESLQSVSHGLPSPPDSLREPSKSNGERARSAGSASSFDFCLEPPAPTPVGQPSEARSSRSSRGYIPTSSTPNSGVVAYTSAFATLISKSLGISSKHSSSSSTSRLSRTLSNSQAAIETQKLIGGVESHQNTPPQTPRTRSQEDENGSGMSTPSKSSAKEIPTATGPVLGKLTVVISEGRGLRPSIDPYVVCEFQLSQYISDGPVSGTNNGGSLRTGPYGSSGISIQPAGGDRQRPMAIPMRSRQSSSSGRDAKTQQEVTNPHWNHKAVFDVVGEQAEIDVSVYDRTEQETFLGHVRFCPQLKEYSVPYDNWFTLEARDAGEEDSVMGEIHLKISFQKTDKKHHGPEDFDILKLIGKGTFGRVFQVRKRDTHRIYAMKVLSKKVIVQKKEVAHTLGERNILVRTARSDSPFIVGLKFSFQTPTDLYLVTDYMSGGELFWHLQKEGRFNETRAKFYVAELILALQHLHKHDIVYRDLKPENILLDANGHIALCDFGLSKANLAESDTTNTFCGTTEYLAPEVLLDEHGYTKMVDFWSLGVLVFEMCCGWSPFYADDTQQMYRNIAFGKVRFPRDALSVEGRNFVKGLLNRNPRHRLGANGGAAELMAHPFFADVDWNQLAQKNVVPPFKPKLKSELDVSNFDPEFTNAMNQGGSLNARAAALASGINPASTPLSPTVQANFEGFTFVDESAMDKHFAGRSNDLSLVSTREEREDDDWERVEKGDRMSGVMHPHDSEEGIFSRFDD